MSTPLPPALADALPGLPQALWEELVEHYSADGRHYHDVAHLRALDRHFADVAAGPGWQQPEAVALAILFHDVIYVSGRKDNEERSGALARESIARHLHEAAIDIDRVVELIEWTAQHGKIEPGEVSEDPDAAHFLDADMAPTPRAIACMKSRSARNTRAFRVPSSRSVAAAS